MSSDPGSPGRGKERDGLAKALLFLPILLLPVAGASSDDPDVLPRSVYVPVRIEVAPCLRDVVVRTEDGEVRALAPGRLVAQFAFHPQRPGPDPAWERLSVEGWIRPEAERASAADRYFRTALVITPASIYVGRKRLDLGTMERLAQFRRRLDLRMPEQTLRLAPPGCTAALRTDARPPGPPAPS